MFVLFSVMSVLFSVMACNEDDDSVVSDRESNDLGEVIVHQMNDSDGLSLSKRKKRYKRKRGVVYIYNFDDDSLEIHQTMKISTMDGSIMQEWLLSDLNENYFRGQKKVPNKNDATKMDYFYKWKGEICDMSQGTWDEYVRTVNDEAESGFHVMNVIDLQKIKEIAGDFSDVCDTLAFKPFGYYAPPKFTNEASNLVYLWLFPVASTRKYYGMQANAENGCGVLARIVPGSDSFSEVYTNVRDIYARVRLVRDISAEQW